MIRFVGKNLEEIQNLSKKVYTNLNEIIIDKKNTFVYAPVSSPVDKIKNKYRWRIILKGKLNSKLLNILYKAIDVQVKDGTSITVDINPNSMM